MALSRELGVSDRATFLGQVPDEELIRLYEGAGAVFVGPINEDYGLVTLEALEAERPVVATADSGGPLEFVEHEASGLVVEPEPEAVGDAFERLLTDEAFSRELGVAGRERVQSIGWDNVLVKLFG